ncbi:MAG: cytochrome c biogenesis protein CcsA, partial [Flavobacteriales bacterium]
SIALNDFILDRYPGSNSPSSYKSIITLLDERSGLRDRREIFMNNVMDYGGFRFFQSGYEPDESGTILSVNHDAMGTKVTYMGYALLTLGFLLSFFDKRSRFQTVRKMILQSRKKRLMLWFLALASFSVHDYGFAQNAAEHAPHQANETHEHDGHQHDGHHHDDHKHKHDEQKQAHHNPQFQSKLAETKQQLLAHSLTSYKAINQEHAALFGRLICQTRDGRFQPINSLAIDILHKISRLDQIKLDSIGQLTPMQVMLDFMIAPDFWKMQDIIYIRNTTLAKEIGFDKKMVSFSDFFDEKGAYKLQEFTEVAFRKKPAEQNAFDKEIIKLDERINVFMMVMRGTLLQIFPKTGDENHKWMNWTDSLANVPIGNIDSELKSDSIRPIDEVTYSNLLMLYNMALVEAKQDDDYTLANQIVKSISTLQRTNTEAGLLPSEELINGEILYNKLNIFKRLERMYSIFALFLLILSLLEVSIKNKTTNSYIFLVKAPLKFFTISLLLAFLYHTFGMAMRWYLSGHAPWSNGYEALLLIAWASLFSGFIFSRYSKITLAATALLAFFVLMTAGHSNYDPQLTNLQPVLKSYWLIIHVAAITSSYGFFGLAFVLGLINLGFYAFQNYSNKKHINSLVQELTYISELTISIGLMLAAVGTFLGGVWANESWGRYWGWDAKETWALVVVLVYAIILHFRFIPGLKDKFWFNVGSVLSFSSVLMTFVGVNYYLSKGLHSYARGEAPAFPLWAWYSIFAVFVLILIAFLRRKKLEH